MPNPFEAPKDAMAISIVMPCLNEMRSLPACIANAQASLVLIQAQYGLSGEVLVADNGSTDGSQALAHRLGARVAQVAEAGYGAALRGGFSAADGHILIMGDADGSYDFCDAVAMVGEILKGADLCMGSRFKGEIKPGAMPWKNRYIGNPILTGVLNLLFRTGASDAHCGLRAITKSCFQRLGLTGAGMEFASEMVIKAALKGEKIVETPCTLSPDLRDRPPHLRPWRDGWRHLRYLFMLSPAWLFAAPAILGSAFALPILALATQYFFSGESATATFGNYWIILCAAMLSFSHLSALMALAAHLYGVREGYRRPKTLTRLLAPWLSLETMLILGAVSIALGMAVLAAVAVYWSSHRYAAIYGVLPAVAGTLMVTLGAQNMFGGFLLAIIGGNEAQFLGQPAPAAAQGPRRETGLTEAEA